MTLLVNAGALGSQPTQPPKNTSYAGFADNSTVFNPVNNKASKADDLTNPSIKGVIGAMSNHISTKPGKYGIAFDATVVQEMYKKRVLNNLDMLVEAASVNLNPGSKDITELLLTKLLTDAAAKENTTSAELAKNYGRFINSFRTQLANQDYPKIMQGDVIAFFSEVINKAGVDQCISYCEYTFLEYTTFYGNSKTTPAGVAAAFYVAYLLGYENVWKQNDATYKTIYESYVAKKQGKQYGTYQYISSRHGMPVSFTRYGVQFGAIAPFMILSKSAQATSYLWDQDCDCPDSDLFNVWSSSQTKATFIIP
ncbi:hypothetical protein BLX24_10135 [Arsenicibacter rosenii]|uniref:Uncharacterized protein n=2 Tax=Arsenicibacter rosenii TaxID=1750698 RepID=A0A1S2VKM9_9BACT|nr:hypothetical protein BLX24_10135 [Arsenicibacter rosenii]